VGNLSAISADLGSITAGTITGGVIRTAASGARVVLDTPTTATAIMGYDSGGTETLRVNTNTGAISVACPASHTGTGISAQSASASTGAAVSAFASSTSALSQVNAVQATISGSGQTAVYANAGTTGGYAIRASGACSISGSGAALDVSGQVAATSLRINAAPNTTTGGGALSVPNLPTGTAAQNLRWVEVNINGTAHWVACVPK
jgi:hypothetical protein